MTTTDFKTNTWNFTCNLCKVIRNVSYACFIGMIAFGESAGRARAASELSRQGFHKEARALMMGDK